MTFLTSKIKQSVFESLYSEEIKQYLFNTFGSPGLVQSGIDNDEYPNPELEEFPSIVVYNPVRVEKSQQDREKKYSVLIALAIKSGEDRIQYIEPVTGTDSNTSIQGKKIFLDSDEIENFREKVEEVLYSENTREIFSNNLKQYGILLNTDSDTLTDSDFPIFRTNIILNVSIKTNSRNILRAGV